LAVGEPPANPFSDKKEIRRGEISEKGKGGGWWGRVRLSADRRRGSELALIREIGSDFSVKSHQYHWERAPLFYI